MEWEYSNKINKHLSKILKLRAMQHKKRIARNDQIRALRAKGLTFEAIGAKFNLSRQRVHAIFSQPQ